MAKFIVLGKPMSWDCPHYRGTLREGPYWDDKENLNPELYRAFQKHIDVCGEDVILTDFAIAKYILNAYRRYSPRGSAFELVEVVDDDSAPTLGTDLLGFDISLGYYDSRLTCGLKPLLNESDDRGTRCAPAVACMIYEVFAPKLNEHRLFSDYATACWCKQCCDALQIIEPGCLEFGDFTVCGLYRIPV